MSLFLLFYLSLYLAPFLFLSQFNLMTFWYKLNEYFESTALIWRSFSLTLCLVHPLSIPFSVLLYFSLSLSAVFNIYTVPYMFIVFELSQLHNFPSKLSRSLLSSLLSIDSSHFFFQYDPLFLAILFFLFFDITVSLSFFSTSKKYSSFHSFNSKLIQTLFSSSLSFDSTHSFIRYYLFFR